MYDLIVVGSGIAGLYASIRANEAGLRVLLITKSNIDEASTKYAQGGIAAAVGAGDSPQKHLQDTIAAGNGLVNEEAAHILCFEAASRINDLSRFGVQFDSNNGMVSLGKEGAHSEPRILHARGDGTGLEIESSLAKRAQENFDIRENTIHLEIILSRENSKISATGIRTLDLTTGVEENVSARNIMLATGGAGQAYSVTTNPKVSTGDGIALGFAAGAIVTDLEFTQFHPTALVLPDRPVFLISEALRGDGARLLNNHGQRFMARYSSDMDLAPRDIVARAIVEECRRENTQNAWLDIRSATTGNSTEWLMARFPQISSSCADAGIDISKDLIPVSPAAHYLMGGLCTNTDGETSVPHLFAIGETACTGVHGANRLASNSLLETVIFAHRAIEKIQTGNVSSFEIDGSTQLIPISMKKPNGSKSIDPRTVRESIQKTLWDKVGVVRTKTGLEQANEEIKYLSANFQSDGSRNGYETGSLLIVAQIMIEAAVRRTESRGAHYRSDYPHENDSWRTHIFYKHEEIR